MYLCQINVSGFAILDRRNIWAEVVRSVVGDRKFTIEADLTVFIKPNPEGFNDRIERMSNAIFSTNLHRMTELRNDAIEVGVYVVSIELLVDSEPACSVSDSEMISVHAKSADEAKQFEKIAIDADVDPNDVEIIDLFS